MTSLIRICIATVTALSISATLSNAADYVQITKKADFAEIAVDKKLVADWGWVRAGSDGKVSGKVGGDSVSGTWKWKGRFYCRNITFGDTKKGLGCFAVHVSGDNIVFIDDKGKGNQVPMKIE